MIRDITSQDLLNFSSLLSLRRVLDTKGLSLHQENIWFHDQKVPIWRLGRSPIVVLRAWYRASMYFEAESPGSWWMEGQLGYRCRSGRDLVALQAFLDSRESVPMLLRAYDLPDSKPPSEIVVGIEYSEKRAFQSLGQRLDFDHDHPRLTQQRNRCGWSDDCAVSASSPPFLEPEVIEHGPCLRYIVKGPWPEHEVARLPFLGEPHRLFPFQDAQGRVRQHLGEWKTNWGATFLRAFTLRCRIDDPPRQRWMDLRASCPLPPYQLERVQEFPNAAVLILDDCGRCEELNEALAESAMSSRFVSVAWPAGLAETTPDDTDWTSLAGRRLFCLAEDTAVSVGRAVAVLETLRANGFVDVSVKLSSGGCHGL